MAPETDVPDAVRSPTFPRVEDAFLTGYCARKVGEVTTLHHGAFSCGEMVPRWGRAGAREQGSQI